jgi:hypothetical protein
MFRKSANIGNTFGETITLSNIPAADSFNQEIAAMGNNVYVVWQVTPLPTSDQNYLAIGDTEIDVDNNSDANSVGGGNRFASSVSFVSSEDNGETFKDVKNLSDGAFKSYPKVAAYEDKVYVIWNVGIIGDGINRENNESNSLAGNGIFLTKSLDGRSFGKTIKLNTESDPIGESQVTAYGNNVYIVWGGNPDEKVAGNLFYARSSNNGTSFTTARPLTEKDTLNVEVAARNNTVYMVSIVQDSKELSTTYGKEKLSASYKQIERHGVRITSYTTTEGK